MLNGKFFFKWSNLRNFSAALLIPTLVACGGDSGSSDTSFEASGIITSSLSCSGTRVWSLSGNSYVSEAFEVGDSEEFPGCAIYWRYDQSSQCYDLLAFNKPPGSVVSLQVIFNSLTISGTIDELNGTHPLATVEELVTFSAIPICD